MCRGGGACMYGCMYVCVCICMGLDPFDISGIDSCQEGNAFKAFAQQLPLLQNLGPNDTGLNLTADALLCLVQSVLDDLPKRQVAARLSQHRAHHTYTLTCFCSFGRTTPTTPCAQGSRILSGMRVCNKFFVACFNKGIRCP